MNCVFNTVSEHLISDVKSDSPSWTVRFLNHALTIGISVSSTMNLLNYDIPKNSCTDLVANLFSNMSFSSVSTVS